MLRLDETILLLSREQRHECYWGQRQKAYSKLIVLQDKMVSERTHARTKTWPKIYAIQLLIFFLDDDTVQNPKRADMTTYIKPNVPTRQQQKARWLTFYQYGILKQFFAFHNAD